MLAVRLGLWDMNKNDQRPLYTTPKASASVQLMIYCIHHCQIAVALWGKTIKKQIVKLVLDVYLSDERKAS